MSVHFQRPIGIIEKQGKFSGREVGLTHPDTDAHIKLTNEGDIHIMADDNLGIIISKAKRTVFIVGNAFKLLTNEEDGFKWNQLAFNPYATDYSEAALVAPVKANSSMYDDISKLIK